ncbi:serine/threonine protein kinase, partial [bacterium]|nr:serine/threonine protein kinase [bacterium]
MATSFACSSCGLAIPFSQGEPGKAARCPSCGAAVAAALASSHASGADARRSSSSDRIGGTDALALEVAQARSDSSRRFGSFLLLSEIGRGGMGVVHRAFDERLRRVVALKRIHDDGADPRRFRKEAETAARLSHPAIVKIFDTGDVDGKLYLSMELVVGKTLAERRLPLTKALEALHRGCLAVQYAHEQGVIHRDLKPQNVIIEDGTGAPRLLDFGLARQVDGTRLTKTGTTLGTPAFMPPEQAGGAREEIDARSDVYSLGATLYYILTDRPPFEGATAYNVVAAVLTKDPIAPGELNPRAKGDLETIAQKCLEKEKRRRYGSAEALAQDLERYLAGQPILARPIGRFERGRRWVKRNRLPAAGALAVLVSIAGSGGFLGWERRARLRSGRETAASEAERSRKAFEKGSSSADETIGRGLDALEA